MEYFTQQLRGLSPGLAEIYCVFRLVLHLVSKLDNSCRTVYPCWIHVRGWGYTVTFVWHLYNVEFLFSFVKISYRSSNLLTTTVSLVIARSTIILQRNSYHHEKSTHKFFNFFWKLWRKKNWIKMRYELNCWSCCICECSILDKCEIGRTSSDCSFWYC